MRKAILCTALAIFAALSAGAEGYQVNTLSAKQIGMAHTGIAMKLGAESMYFNPAGLGFMNSTMDYSISAAAIMPTATCRHQGKKFETDNDISTPIGIHTAFSINPNLKAGLSFYTPYGSSINWTDNWAGAVLNQNVSLKVYTLQPTLSWRITDRLSIGAGLMLSWGEVNLNKGLVPASTLDGMITGMQAAGALPASIPLFGSTTPASINLEGKAGLVAGINAGVLYDINDRISIGASFRSKQMMKVKSGNASLIYANEVAQQLLGSTLGVLNQANFRSKMPAPWVLGLGVQYKPVSALTLALDARLTGWKSYRSLDVEFLSEQLTPYNQYITKDYHNAWAFSLGAQYALTQRFDLRAGVMVDTTPVDSRHYNPETPGMTKINPAAGFSFRPGKGFSIDVAFMYAAGTGANGVSCTYDDLLAKSLGQPYERTFKADYRCRALIPSVGVSWNF